MENETLFEAVERVWGVSVVSYEKKLEQSSKKVEQLLNQFSADELCKPFNAEHGTYVCGNALEDIKEVMDDTVVQLKYVRTLILAYVSAYESCPEDDDMRMSYVRGFMYCIDKMK